jgi:uroporphyrin-III C-methyltransferase
LIRINKKLFLSKNCALAFALQFLLCIQNAGAVMNNFLNANVKILPSALLKASVAGAKPTRRNEGLNDGYKNTRAGKVWLIGAGPGDAELLTLKALRAINSADVIFYDYLVSAEIRSLFPKNIPAFYVGKAKNKHSIAQEDLNQLLVSQAARGLNVCRVKGGDPFVFGRGGEELLELRSAGIDAEVIPGITSASGCSTYADIPLTHRGLSQGCTFVTGHAEKNLELNWTALAQLKHTLVFYMGLTRADEIAQNLLAGGLAAATPVAIIENGCRKNQRNIISTLSEFPADVIREQVQSPALIIVGEVVRIKEKLQAAVENHAAESQYLLA